MTIQKCAIGDDSGKMNVFTHNGFVHVNGGLYVKTLNYKAQENAL